MDIKTQTYKLLNDSKKNKEQFQLILKMLQYNLLEKEKGIYNSDILFYKSNGINRFILYIETKKIEENILFEINEYYFKKFNIPKKNSDVYIIINIEEKNKLVNYFLDCFMELPNKNNNMVQIVPIIIDNSEMKIYVGNYGKYSAMAREVLNIIYKNIQNDIKSFMNLYYMENDCNITDYYKEISVDYKKSTKKIYNEYYKRGNILNKFNINEFSQKNITNDILKTFLIILFTFIINICSYNKFLELLSIYCNSFSLIYIVFFALRYVIKKNYILNCSKIKIDSSINLEDEIIKSLDKRKYKKEKNGVYKKNCINIIFIKNIDEIEKNKINEKNSIIFLITKSFNHNCINQNNINKNTFLITRSGEDSYLYIHRRNKSYKKIKVIVNIFSDLYNDSKV